MLHEEALRPRATNSYTVCLTPTIGAAFAASRKRSMVARSPAPTPSNNASALVAGLAGAVVLVAGGLIAGGYWLQAQRSDETLQRQQANIYQNYLRSTQPTTQPTPQTVAPPAPSAASVAAQETRQYLLAHPAVTPGAAFDQPGVQTTGHAIVRAIDQAKGL